MNFARCFRSGFAVALLALAAVSCSTVDFVTGQEVNNMYLLDEDVDLGASVMAEAIAEMENEGVPVDADPKKVKQIREIVQRITAVSHLPDLPYEVVVFHTNIVNAMAAPGGKVMVFEGLYKGEDRMVDDENELAAVIGHEIAHVTCRHTTEALTREAPFDILMLIGAIYAESQEEDLATGLQVAFLAVHGLWFPKYSRRDEAETDAVGMMYMAKAGYDPAAAPRLWKRLYDKQGDEGFLNFLSSHPTSKARYEALEKLLPEAILEYQRAKSGNAQR
ncbi:MAG TPA: M48 family metallopeptidase [Kiritimatiellia bacterium]|jgi:predicted Zn-dependent protease